MRTGTVIEPNWVEGKAYSYPDFSIRYRHYTHATKSGPVVGIVASIMFTLDAPSDVVWKYMKDFNTFEGPFGIQYSGVWGELYTSEEHDLGKQTLTYGGAYEDWTSVPSQVVRVIPQHQLTLFETIPADGSSGGISPGFHTILLNDHNGKTVVTAVFEHAERIAGVTEQEALQQSMWGPDKYDTETSMKRWRDDFIPTLKKLIAEK